MIKVLIAVFPLAGIFLLLQYNLVKSPSTTPIVESPKVEEPLKIKDKEVNSPDGIMKVTMRVQKNSDNTVTFSFFTNEVSGKNQISLFSKSLSPTGRMEIPQNAWSPDNRLVFIHENKDGVLDWFVFKADGTAFSNGKNFLDIQEAFINKKSDYYIANVTGWAGPGLLQVKTAYDKSTKGPSFWFDTTSNSFIQLASR